MPSVCIVCRMSQANDCFHNQHFQCIEFRPLEQNMLVCMKQSHKLTYWRIKCMIFVQTIFSFFSRRIGNTIKTGHIITPIWCRKAPPLPTPLSPRKKLFHKTYTYITSIPLEQMKPTFSIHRLMFSSSKTIYKPKNIKLDMPFNSFSHPSLTQAKSETFPCVFGA